MWLGNGLAPSGNDGLSLENNFDIRIKPGFNLQLILLHKANKIEFDVYLYVVSNSLEFFFRMGWSTSGGPIPKGMPDQWGLATAFFFVFTVSFLAKKYFYTGRKFRKYFSTGGVNPSPSLNISDGITAQAPV